MRLRGGGRGCLAFHSSESVSCLTASKGANEKNTECEPAGALCSGHCALPSPPLPGRPGGQGIICHWLEVSGSDDECEVFG